jgi:hypothetical protein
MFAFSEPQRVSAIFAASGWSPPRFDRLDLDLDIAAGRGLDEALAQSAQIGVISGALRNQPSDAVNAALNAMRKALGAHLDGASVRLPGAMWLVSSTPA